MILVFHKITFFSALLLFSLPYFAQEKLNDGHKKFYYENGVVSSEGEIKNGKPEGYWKTYYPTGILKSEGNRKNYLLDSTWVFYNERGDTIQKINYKANKKHGIKTLFSSKCNIILEENFENDIKQGYTIHYYDTLLFDSVAKIKQKEIFYEENMPVGNAFEYGLDGRIITIIVYKKGTLMGKEFINRYDVNNKKTGIWKKFYEDTGKIQQEATYKNGLLNGYLKEYDKKGMLINVTLYINGDPQLFAEELSTLDIKKEFYDDGTVKKEGTYDVTGKEHGKFKYYDENGNLELTERYEHGILLAKGLVDKEDRRKGYWEEYYITGELKSKGHYKDGEKIEEWEYFFVDNQLQQKGNYMEGGKPIGKWLWYYPNGQILREENYRKGLRDGMMEEFLEDGTLITKGEFIDGKKEDEWFYELGDHKEIGKYRDGERHGEWIYYYPNGKINFEGKFVDGLPDGKHKHYFENGKIKREEHYLMGTKTNTWKSYNELGEISLMVEFKNGENYKINGTKVK